MTQRAHDGSGPHARRVNALGAFITQRLDDLKMSRAQLGEAIGMSRSSVYRLLGDEPPERMATEKLLRLADVLGVDSEQLSALWDGSVYALIDSDREDLVRSFVLSTGELSLDELRAVLDVARSAARLARRDE